MFNKALFQYDRENHLGYYKGKLIPSATQLCEILFPLDDTIPEKRLKVAADRGTKIHSFIEDVNNIVRDKGLYRTLNEEISMFETEKEVIDYFSLIYTYKLEPYDFENLIFLLDENDDPICYGHFDLVVKATEDIAPFTKDTLYMTDLKTTSVFAKAKTALQTAIYRVGYNQLIGNGFVDQKTFGIHLRDGVKLIPLKEYEAKELIALCKGLRGVFDARRETN